jgi:diguanylate cyclase (GGDEF)-like protein
MEKHNQKLSLLGKFNHALHSCESEQEIIELVREHLPGIVGCERGALYCTGPERHLQKTTQWPEDFVAENIIKQSRCDAILQPRGIQDDGNCCRACNLSDQSNLMCVPLKSGRTLTGLLQLTFPEAGLACSGNTPEKAITQMAADQLALALCNARSRQQLGNIVMRDGLTGAFNRRYMQEALQREILRSLRAETPLAILMVDLDHFKQVNDTMGHAVGDLVLKELAKTLIASVRASDIVCRYGGEEFLVAFPDTSATAAKNKADSLRRQIHEISGVVKHHRMISASIGVAALPEHGTDMKTLLRAADEALYEAKRGGRDRVVIAECTKAARPSWDAIEATLSRWSNSTIPEVAPRPKSQFSTAD